MWEARYTGRGEFGKSILFTNGQIRLGATSVKALEFRCKHYQIRWRLVGLPQVSQSDTLGVGQSDSLLVGKSDSLTVWQPHSMTVWQMWQSDCQALSVTLWLCETLKVCKTYSLTMWESDSLEVWQSESLRVLKNDILTVWQPYTQTVWQSDSLIV